MEVKPGGARCSAVNRVIKKKPRREGVLKALVLLTEPGSSQAACEIY